MNRIKLEIDKLNVKRNEEWRKYGVEFRAVINDT